MVFIDVVSFHSQSDDILSGAWNRLHHTFLPETSSAAYYYQLAHSFRNASLSQNGTVKLLSNSPLGQHAHARRVVKSVSISEVPDSVPPQVQESKNRDFQSAYT